jgi:hypothetical protein
LEANIIESLSGVATKKKKRFPNPSKKGKTDLYNDFIKALLAGQNDALQLYEVQNEDGTIDLDFDEDEQ